MKFVYNQNLMKIFIMIVIKYKIIKINTIIDESLPFESKFIIDDSIQKK